MAMLYQEPCYNEAYYNEVEEYHAFIHKNSTTKDTLHEL